MRRQPVAFFLGDAAFTADSKFRALSRRLTDPDDFNSAVGAYFIVLAAARRNGSPTIDARSESSSRFVDDLEEAGLLLEDGFPPKTFAIWGPSRPKFPSDKPAPPAPSAPSAPNGSESYDLSVSSESAPLTPSPLPSTPIRSSTGGGPGEGLPNIDSTVARVWEEATGRNVISSGNFAIVYLDDVCTRHPVYEVCAAILRARKQFDHVPATQAMVAALRPILDPFPDAKAAAKAEREREAAAASRRGTAATLRRNHELGAHRDEPHGACPVCQEATA